MGFRIYDSRLVEHVRRDLIPSLRAPKQQVLWLGCSDSGYEETRTLDLLPEELFVVRNIGNLALDSDLSFSSAVQYAINALQIRHIVVCGHYGCNVVRTRLPSRQNYYWQRYIRDLHKKHCYDLERVGEWDRDRQFVRLNILAQMKNVRDLLQTLDLSRRNSIQIHGLVYDRTEDRAYRLVDPEAGS